MFCGCVPPVLFHVFFKVRTWTYIFPSMKPITEVSSTMILKHFGLLSFLYASFRNPIERLLTEVICLLHLTLAKLQLLGVLCRSILFDKICINSSIHWFIYLFKEHLELFTFFFFREGPSPHCGAIFWWCVRQEEQELYDEFKGGSLPAGSVFFGQGATNFRLHPWKLT